MMHWMLGALGSSYPLALKEAERAQVHAELSSQKIEIDIRLIEHVAQTLETVVMDMLSESDKDEDMLGLLRKYAAQAYKLNRVLPSRMDPLEESERRLHQSSLAVLGELGADAARGLREKEWPALEFSRADWYSTTFGTIVDVWLRLIRKRGWEDRDAVLEGIMQLRDSQLEFERIYFQEISAAQAKSAALELVALYHLAKAAEILAVYVTDGVVDGSFQINNLLDMHFDRALGSISESSNYKLEPIIRLLSATARQLADNAIWTVTRAVNSRVTRFVKNLVDRGRGAQAIFDVLPPQRRALAERGLLGSSRRAVVVSLPTSSGKTLIAQFRILQALNQFDHEKGWVAYLAPTRTLVRQVARRLRRDFEPLGVVVEQVSPALEVDGVESELLLEKKDGSEFRILVTTPEKLDLMLRQGWEEDIGRPLTLVVVDEAHNIQEGARGLKLELLLSTINAECRLAQFLLLTPFIDNAKEVARWLGDANSDDISLSVDWQPNDRVIGVVSPEKGKLIKGRSYDYKLNLDAISTSRATLSVDGLISLEKDPECAKTFSKISEQSEIAAATAVQLEKRGPVIVMHSTPTYVWLLANKIKQRAKRLTVLSDRVRLVKEFLALEMGEQFPLVELLSFGIGVHHAGLSDDTRALMEWLFENEEIRYLVATTTIAQGVNFPVSGVVMAANTYFQKGVGAVEMPAADFWNIAGRAGRVDQGKLGVVALAAADCEKAEKLKLFINKQAGALNSSLVKLVSEAGESIMDLQAIVYSKPEWSAFVQYLAHTYRQMGQPFNFEDQIEQVLRGTFGFAKLKASQPDQASKLLSGIRKYAEYLGEPRQPLKLVDSTGFSLQSIKTAMKAAGEEGLGKNSWNANELFKDGTDTLQKMMGVLLKVPELRDSLNEVTGKSGPDRDKLSLIVKDWVNGETLESISAKYFTVGDRDSVAAITACGQNLFGKLAQTAAWGVGALLSITGGEIPEDERRSLNNLASRIFYGVSEDEAISLRLLGVPRMAAVPLALHMKDFGHRPISEVRSTLRNTNLDFWVGALGTHKGQVYRDVWRVLEGLD